MIAPLTCIAGLMILSVGAVMRSMDTMFFATFLMGVGTGMWLEGI